MPVFVETNLRPISVASNPKPKARQSWGTGLNAAPATIIIPKEKKHKNAVADEIFRFRELKQQTTVDTATRDEQPGRITELQDFIRSQSADLTEFDESLVKRWVHKITVWLDRYTVELKSGLSVDIEP